MGAGSVVLAQSPQIVSPGGTAIVPVSCLIGNAAVGKAKPFTSGTITTAATLVRPTSINIQAITAAGPTATNGWVWEELFDGEFLLLPGNVLCVGAVAAAGTTPLVGLGLTWEETPS